MDKAAEAVRGRDCMMVNKNPPKADEWGWMGGGGHIPSEEAARVAIGEPVIGYLSLMFYHAISRIITAISHQCFQTKL